MVPTLVPTLPPPSAARRAPPVVPTLVLTLPPSPPSAQASTLIITPVPVIPASSHKECALREMAPAVSDSLW